MATQESAISPTPHSTRSLAVRKAAAKAVVAASTRTGRPVTRRSRNSLTLIAVTRGLSQCREVL